MNRSTSIPPPGPPAPPPSGPGQASNQPAPATATTPGASAPPTRPFAPASAPALEIANLSHRFKRNLALAGVTFNVARQSIHGFVGPNGAGKTTTLKIVATLLRPQTGWVRVLGMDVVSRQKKVRQRIGFMPDHFSMYRQMTVFEYLDFFGAAYGLGHAKRNQVISDVLALTDMLGRQDDLIKGLSRGMQQRVSLARVLINDPELLLLDEPASGLDPRARIELMEILQDLRRRGKTIFISSHILTELATLCDSVTIIDRGSIKYSGEMAALLTHDAQELGYTVELAHEHGAARKATAALPGVIEISKHDALPRYTVRFDSTKTDPTQVLVGWLEAGAQVVAFKPIERHLNQAFMALTQPGVPGGEPPEADKHPPLGPTDAADSNQEPVEPQ